MNYVSTEIKSYLPDTVGPLWDFILEYPLLLIVLFAAIGYAAGKLLQVTLRHVLKKISENSRFDLNDKLVSFLTAPVVQTTVILALIAAEKVFNLGDSLDRFLVRILLTSLLVLWGRAWFMAATLAINAFAQDEHSVGLLKPRTRPLFEMGAKAFMLSLLLWLLMTIWNIDGTAWLASAGVIGIAVGLAARDTLANLISGISIIADAPYKIGDYIILDTGERGVVTTLGMRSTRLLTRDDVEISIPNAVMGNAKITNESGGPGVPYRIRVPVGVAYDVDVDKAIRTLEQIAHDNELILEDPAPRVRMRAFGEYSKNFELLGWIGHPELRGRTTHQLLIEIDKRFQREGITIPYPQRDVHIKGPGAVPERLQDDPPETHA